MVLGRAFNIYIAEDDQEDVALLKEVLMERCPEMTFVWFHDGEELSSKLFRARTSPSMVLLDLNMPKKDGRQVLREIRSRPDFASLPVVIVTTSDYEPDRQLAVLFPNVYFIRKPFSLDEYGDFASSLAAILKNTASLQTR